MVQFHLGAFVSTKQLLVFFKFGLKLDLMAFSILLALFAIKYLGCSLPFFSSQFCVLSLLASACVSGAVHQVALPEASCCQRGSCPHYTDFLVRPYLRDRSLQDYHIVSFKLMWVI